MKLSWRIVIFGLIIMLIGIGLIASCGSDWFVFTYVGFTMLGVGGLISLLGLLLPNDFGKPASPNNKDDDPEQKS